MRVTLIPKTIVKVRVIITLGLILSADNAKSLDAQRSVMRINPRDGATMIYIPSGSFAMGDDDAIIADYSTTPPQRNNPRHKVTLSGFYIYKNAITMAMYKRYCQQTGAAMPPPTASKQDDQPIVNITWDEAVRYCSWAGVSLPSEAQWERAARGTDGRQYPWGNDWDSSKLWHSTNKEGDAGEPRSVGSYPAGASPDGVLDMAGNVCQWCADWYDKDFWSSERAQKTDPVNDVPADFRVVRGGSWYYTDPVYFRCAFRYRFPTVFRSGDFGFRGVITDALLSRKPVGAG